MIRVARTYIAQPGVEHELINALKDIKSYARTEGVESRIFTEPWGRGGVVHTHNDFDDAGEAQEWWQTLLANSRVQELIGRMEGLLEGHRQASFLMEANSVSSSQAPTPAMERVVRVVRSYDAKPGTVPELVEIANDFRGFVASQGVPVAVFTEPWGIGGRLHYHVDYPDAGAALSGLENVTGRQRAQESLARVTALTEGYVMRNFLYEVE